MTTRIVRAKDGVTEVEARAMGAKLNILEGQGKVEDYADFFRATKISEAEAERQGLLARVKGKTGFMVGRFASEDVWAGYRNGKVSAEKAAVIADIGRDNDGLQSAGLESTRFAHRALVWRRGELLPATGRHAPPAGRGTSRCPLCGQGRR